MIRINNVRLPLNVNPELMRSTAARLLGVSADDVPEVTYLRRSLDARDKGDIHYVASLAVYTPDEETILRTAKGSNISQLILESGSFPAKCTMNFRPVVIGFGPAGIFAALSLAEAGLCPLVLERGEDVVSRRETVRTFWKDGTLNPESNVQFGEGGAGTFSDGKLNTGTSDPRNRLVLKTFVDNGAPEDILWEAKPHIGTDLLGDIIVNIRRRIESLGGEVVFGAKLTGFQTDGNRLSAVSYLLRGEPCTVPTRACVLAVGHSARDVFEFLHRDDFKLERKPFAIGLRIEHLRADIDKAMYGKLAGSPLLGAADYKLAVKTKYGGLYSFCMCPGGQVVAAASEEGRVAVNGMSLHARNFRNSNSALLVGIAPESLEGNDPLEGMNLQRRIETAAYIAGGGNYRAPVTLVGDFLNDRLSNSFRRVQPSYAPSVAFARPEEYLPENVTSALRVGIPLMARKNRAFSDPDAVLTGVESRSSSPVRIMRDSECRCLSLADLYPCGEGAGYAGGIVSAAVDGIRCAEAMIEHHRER